MGINRGIEVRVKNTQRIPLKVMRALTPSSEIKAGVYLLNERVFIFWEEHGIMYLKTKTGLRKYEPGVDFEDGDLPPEVKAAVEITVVNKDAALRMMSEGAVASCIPKEQQVLLKPLASYMR